ncbi:MAG: nucleotide sugar dehydrogenase [Myxococcales bacterium]|nr:nucleotide sugar dehydrogenase [Myxococcota bacterium]MDW8282939.1 nucleotide sugar dehydrogenase [Myxococcales bacterium]
MNLLEKIRRHEARVTVIGIGYVGLPLVVEMARAGFHVTGYDKNEDKVRSVQAGRSYISDVSDADLQPLVQKGLITTTTDPDCLAKADVVIICVPTPLNKSKDPDNSYIVAAADDLVPRMHRDMLVVLESTTFPGFTREVLLPKLRESGLKPGEDFYLCFSPERVDPGNKRFHTKNTPKVIGGITPNCLEVIQAMYGEVIDRLVPVSSTDAAEMVKLLENTFRAVNIGLVNEVAIMCHRLGLDTWEVIDAAATKPFGFMPFYPGPGLGGHCIPVDPLYLSWKLRTLKYEARFIDLADQINGGMPQVVVERVRDALNDRKQAVNGSKILVLGVAYKKDIDDVRESPALDVIEMLQRLGAEVRFHDPHVPSLRLGEQRLYSVPMERLGDYDAVVILTDHSAVDYAKVVDHARLVVDTRNATRAVRGSARATIVSL